MIITISGKARHGKSVSAEILKQMYERRGYRVAITSFASHIKSIYTNYFEWDGRKTEEARAFLQWLGTEHIRSIDPLFHVRRTQEEIELLKGRFDIFIIPDCRFPNELIGDYALKVVREGYKSELTEEQQKHISETALDDYDKFDLVITAESGDLVGLANQLEEHLWNLPSTETR